jgi:hypothetical protein
MEGRVNFYSDNCDDGASWAKAWTAETRRRTLLLA